MTQFVNVSERYGNAEIATLADYWELNPEGQFEVRPDGIYEYIEDRLRRGEWERIARPVEAQ